MQQDDPALSPGAELRAWLGEIDIYLFDQILKGRFDARRRVLDAGCGDGRNLVYFLRRDFSCHGIDQDASAIGRVRRLATALAPALPAGNFEVGDLQKLPFEDEAFDAVICSAVLHFADDAAHFGRMLEEMWRVLAPNGLLFARLASNIGLEREVGAAGRRVRLPDGSDRFVVDEEMLLRWTDRLGGRLMDPIKTSNVQQQRCMTTWCILRADRPSREGGGIR
jgi:SAM-dependent methyltransferase